MEIRLYGILCNSETKQASITCHNAEELYRLVDETHVKRDKRVETEHNHLCDLEEAQANGTLSVEEQKICEVWHNLNYAIKEMKATFCDEYSRKVPHFSVSAERSCFNFLMALEEFDALYSAEI